MTDEAKPQPPASLAAGAAAAAAMQDAEDAVAEAVRQMGDSLRLPAASANTPS